jgi:hypothetical protein
MRRYLQADKKLEYGIIAVMLRQVGRNAEWHASGMESGRQAGTDVVRQPDREAYRQRRK